MEPLPVLLLVLVVVLVVLFWPRPEFVIALDDGRAEVIFDLGNKIGEFGTYTRLIQKRKYLYGNDIRLYRGATITVQPTRGRLLYLDGELLELPTNVLEIQVGPDQVKVFC